jgi:hypothetical protein
MFVKILVENKNVAWQVTEYGAGASIIQSANKKQFPKTMNTNKRSVIL